MMIMYDIASLGKPCTHTHPWVAVDLSQVRRQKRAEAETHPRRVAASYSHVCM